MKHVLENYTIDYIGGDIVKPLVETLNVKYGNAKTHFVYFDITRDAFPEVDLWICRDCLFHLSFNDIHQALKNFVDSNIPYLFASTHITPKGFTNFDIETGDFRLIDLFSAPYCFPKDVHFRVADWISPHPEREMCLWSKEQVIFAMKTFRL